MTNKTILKGTYCILINLNQNSKMNVGKLGEINFQKGYYVYIGSALNSLEGRIKRHLSSHKKLHWHVDYLLAHKNTEIVEVIYALNNDRMECKVAEEIADKGSGIKNFGCSDCKCPSHLFYFKKLNDLEKNCTDSFKNLGLTPQTYINKF